ncbi:GNAT family N-acetyltransferase [Galactobacter caseinivorans]|uniref:N-acetyltransferase n=1 Tax=Galactobacter caseinivorans TaxID=2676123 RepID=A0A496PHC0_9MICC|nr:GNAT family protein [Galactobacter caseinivorans]RKW69883.1 N-acetyltransferase [Galactobacter caseinivorans]
MDSFPLTHKPTLEGRLVVLRPFTEADISAMGPVLADPEVQILTGSVASRAQADGASATLDERTLAWYRSRAAQGDRLDLAIVDAQSGECVGEAVLNDVDPENRSCNFRILMGPAGRGRGLGTEATRLILDHAFATTELHRIELEVYSFNPRARRAYEKAGFVAEGVRRDALLFDGEWINAEVMSVLRSDPRPASFRPAGQ